MAYPFRRTLAILAVTLVAVCLHTTAAMADAKVTGPTSGEPTVDAVDEAAASRKTKKKGSSQARLGLDVTGTYRQKARGYVLKGALVKAKGLISGEYDGERVEVVIRRGKKRVLRKTVTLKAAGGKSRFSLSYRIRKAGYYRFSATPTGDSPETPLAARSEYVSVVSSSIKRGAKGVAVRVIQNKLARLKYVVSGDGVFDAALGRALLAFRKANGMSRVERAGPSVGRLLARNRGSFRAKYRKAGRHIEVDLSRQVMTIYDSRTRYRTYHVSTGTSATPTVLGRYYFYLKTPGTNAKQMVHSNFFIRGYAIHGFASVPIYPASHGCVRVPIPNAKTIFDWVRIGDRIDVYR